MAAPDVMRLPHQTGLELAIDERLHAARLAQPWWASVPLTVRAHVIAEASRAFAADAPALAGLLVAATGRSSGSAWGGEIVPTLDALAWLGRRGARILAPRPLRRSARQWYFRATRHRLHWEPYGVVGIVTPGNAPLFLSVPQVAAALLAGNAVVWKPAPSGVAIAVHAASLFHAAGLPGGALEVVTGGAPAAHAIVEGGVDKLFFTGGSEGGLELARRQAARGRPCVLELSGRHVSMVLADADVATAAAGIVWSKLDNGGRNCLAPQLALVERPVLAAFLDAARAAMSQAPVPSIDPASEARLAALVADAVSRGARVVCGGRGRPTLLADVAPGMRVVEDEAGGPVLAVAAVESAEQAIAWIAGSAHRLSASVWTRDAAHARRVARRIDAGQVWINEELHPAAQPEVPLAGRGLSGFGASRGRAGLMEMVQPKVVSETRGARRRHYASSDGAVVDLFRATAGVGFERGVWRRAAAAASLARALVSLARRSA